MVWALVLPCPAAARLTCLCAQQASALLLDLLAARGEEDLFAPALDSLECDADGGDATPGTTALGAGPAALASSARDTDALASPRSALLVDYVSEPLRRERGRALVMFRPAVAVAKPLSCRVSVAGGEARRCRVRRFKNSSKVLVDINALVHGPSRRRNVFRRGVFAYDATFVFEDARGQRCQLDVMLPFPSRGRRPRRPSVVRRQRCSPPWPSAPRLRVRMIMDRSARKLPRSKFRGNGLC